MQGRLNSMDDIIMFQKDEILKTETLILRLKECIVQQNKALLLFQNEKMRLESEREKALALLKVPKDNSYSLESNNERQMFEKEINSVAENENENIFNGQNLLNGELKRKNPSDVDCDIDEKCRKVDKSKDPVTISKTNIILPKIQKHLTKIPIPQIGKNKVIKLIQFKDDICMGGSSGLLLKYKDSNAYQIRDIGVEDIQQMEVVKRTLKFYLVVFTISRIFIFDDSDILVRVIILRGMGNVFNDISLIYIPLKNGLIKKLFLDDFTIKHHITHSHGNVQCFVPGSGKNKVALLTLEDHRLYKSDKKYLKHLDLVEGTENIKRIMRVRFCNFLSYSDDKIWFFNSEFVLKKIMQIENGIKFVEVSDMCGAVVDRHNTVHLFQIVDKGRFGLEKVCTKIDGDITALSIIKRNVLVTVADELIVLDSIG